MKDSRRIRGYVSTVLFLIRARRTDGWMALLLLLDDGGHLSATFLATHRVLTTPNRVQPEETVSQFPVNFK